MVLNEEVRSVELVYAGQNVDVTETATSFYNERQRVEIDLIKSLAIDEAYGIGKNGENANVELKWEKTIICQRQKIPKCHSVRKRKKMLSRLP